MIQEKERMVQNVFYVLNVQNIALKKHSNKIMSKFTKKGILFSKTWYNMVAENYSDCYIKEKRGVGTSFFMYRYAKISYLIFFL